MIFLQIKNFINLRFSYSKNLRLGIYYDMNLQITENKINIIRLNKPETLNAFTKELIDEFIEILEKWIKENNSKPLIITGNGRSFSAGGNLKVMSSFIDQGNPSSYIQMIVPRVNTLIKLISNYQGPTLAILNGSAVGGGLNLALACDFRIAEENAKFRLGFTDIGLTPATGNSFFLPRIIGIPKMLEFSLFSTKLTSLQLLDLNVIHEVYSSTDVNEKLKIWSEKLLGLDPWQVIQIRNLLYKSFTSNLDDHLELEYQTIKNASERELYSKRVRTRISQLSEKD